MPEVWFRDMEQRAGDWHLEVLVAPDGMKAMYRSTHMPTDTMQTKTFKGETSAQAAERAFMERAIELIHG